MKAEIVIKDRVRKLPVDKVDEAIDVAKHTNDSKTPFGIRIKRLQHLLILF
jgi:hypothetical protein